MSKHEHNPKGEFSFAEKMPLALSMEDILPYLDVRDAELNASHVAGVCLNGIPLTALYSFLGDSGSNNEWIGTGCGLGLGLVTNGLIKNIPVGDPLIWDGLARGGRIGMYSVVGARILSSIIKLATGVPTAGQDKELKDYITEIKEKIKSGNIVEADRKSVV